MDFMIFFMSDTASYVDVYQIIAVYAQSLIRAFIISVRYAYISPMRYQLMIEKRQDMKVLSQDFLIFIWGRFTPNTVDRNIDAAMFNLQIEPANWDVQVVGGSLKDDLRERIEDDEYYLNKGEYEHKREKSQFKQQTKLAKRNRQIRERGLQSQAVYKFESGQFYSARNILREAMLTANLLN